MVIAIIGTMSMLVGARRVLGTMANRALDLALPASCAGCGEEGTPLCRECRQGFDLSDSPHSFDEVKRWLQPGEGQAIYAPVGCAACRGIGYSGRSGIFEALVVSPAVRRLILQRETTQVIHQKALEEGMIAFRQSALLKVAQGQTSLEEVMRAVPVEPAALED